MNTLEHPLNYPMPASPEEIQLIAIDIILAKDRSTRRAHRNYVLMHRKAERKIVPKIKEWLEFTDKKLRAGLSRMRGQTPATMVKSIADWEKIRRHGEELIKPELMEILTEGGNAVMERRMVEKQARFDPIGIEAVNWVNTHGAELVVEITAETMQGIRDVITTGIQAGKSMPAIARELRPIVGLNSRQVGAVSNFHTKLIAEGVVAKEAAKKAERYAGRLHRRRTMTIARTESAYALTEGQRQGYGQMGVKNLERVEDPDAPDDDCQMNNGRIYSLAAASGVLPAHPNCEGTWVMSGKIKPPSSYANELSSHAKKYEPGITRSMKGITSDTGASLNKLEFRLKTAGSMERKMAKLAQKHPSMSMEQIAKGIQDTVRYTVVAPTKNFASIVNQIDLQLSRQGYKLKKVTNYYGKKGPYQGINAKYYDPRSKLTFEVQYHTKQGVSIVEKNHLIYEKARVSTNPEIVEALNAQMIKNWDNFVMPQGAENLFIQRANFYKNVTAAEIEIIQTWSDDSYLMIRKYLNAGEIERENMVHQFGIQIKKDAEIMEKLFLTYVDGATEMTLYRGLYGVADDTYSAFKKYKAGEIAQIDTVISSWTTNKSTMKIFSEAEGNNIRFYLKKGRTHTQELDISSFSMQAQEGEVIVNSHRFKITRIEEETLKPWTEGGKPRKVLNVYLEEIGP
ncbi:hypothetical protein LCGC14_0489410 [marine sediment metagenome]|uniref:Uncharacterized protein n=1 Tax=marine sediment metagenome TaxID=412755 RepID=A0A0F9SQB7_9ZZZZ